jgi:hypothetical protein
VIVKRGDANRVVGPKRLGEFDGIREHPGQQLRIEGGRPHGTRDMPGQVVQRLSADLLEQALRFEPSVVRSGRLERLWRMRNGSHGQTPSGLSGMRTHAGQRCTD